MTTHVHAEQLLHYEPAVAEISGTLFKGKAQHPNGSKINFYFVKLNTPANIAAVPKDEINVAENNINEIQVYSNLLEIRNKLEKLVGKKVSVKGTLFHEHTAWHVRALIMEVGEIK